MAPPRRGSTKIARSLTRVGLCSSNPFRMIRPIGGGRIDLFLSHAHRRSDSLLSMNDKPEVWQGTLALMVLKTLERAGSLHGYGIARQIEWTSADLLSVNYGTLYPALLKLEQEGYIASEWGFSDNNRKAKYYQLTRAGRRQIQTEI